MTKKLVLFVKKPPQRLGMTQVDLAERAGVGLRFVGDLEQGKQTLRLDKAETYQLLLGDRAERLGL